MQNHVQHFEQRGNSVRPRHRLAGSTASGLCFRQTRPALRPGFTLVELLVVILLVTLLATFVVFALLNAGELGKVARTRAQIAKIDVVLAEQWDRLRTLRVRFDIDTVLTNAGTTRRDRHAMAEPRLGALREYMRLVLPDRKSDVTDDPVTPGLVRPPISVDYQAQATADWSTQYQGSEALYLILSNYRRGNTTGLEFLRESEKGDLDGDGMKEILDGWGRPIRFLRWPAGFASTKQTLSGQTSPDPFDPLQVHGSDNYLLYPLVVSAGPDGVFDMSFDFDTALHYSTTTPNPNDPYVESGGTKLGQPIDEDGDGETDGIFDNINSHDLKTGIKR